MYWLRLQPVTPHVATERLWDSIMNLFIKGIKLVLLIISLVAPLCFSLCRIDQIRDSFQTARVAGMRRSDSINLRVILSDKGRPVPLQARSLPQRAHPARALLRA
jgi:hypothetical protein